MPKVTFLPMNQVCSAQVGEKLLEVALRAGIPIQHACGGFCACTTCSVQVHSSPPLLAPSEEDEQDRLDRVSGVSENTRLACQAVIQGDVVVEVMNLETSAH